MMARPGSNPNWPRVPRAPRARLFREYAFVVAILTSTALITSGALSIYFSYKENITAMARLQEEQALRAATTIEHFVAEIERQIAWTMPPGRIVSPLALDERRDDYLRLLREYPVIAEVRYLDAAGREQLLISRWQINRIDSQEDYSQDLVYREALAGNTYFGPVYFRDGSEPYMTIAMRERDTVAGVTVAEVNLKLIWELVSRLQISKSSRTYVVDSQGNLIADPEIWLVLRRTNLAALPQVAAALTASNNPGSAPPGATFAPNARGRDVLTSHHAVTSTGWLVFVEQPAGEVLGPIHAQILRTGFLLFAGLATSIAASLLLAHRMVTPIKMLIKRARLIGAGALDQRVEVRTGNELELLAEEFNAMAARLRDSYASLEHQVLERTAHLEDALAALKESEERLQRERATLLAIMASMTDGLIVANASERIRYCNAQAAQFLRLRADDVIGKHVEEVCDVLDVSNRGNGLNRTAWRGKLAHLQERPHFEALLSYPIPRELEVQLFPIAEFDSEVLSIGIVLRDVSSLKLLAYLQERERIAMDLHDGVIQSLYAVTLGLAARERMLGNESDETRVAFRQAQDQIREVIQEARKYIVELRVEHAPGYGLVQGLQQLAGHLTVNGLTPTVDLPSDGNGALDEQATQHVLYIARETISNILRHSKASQVFIAFHLLGNHIMLTIRDNGQGFDLPRAGRRSGDGLRNMDERTAALGGSLEVLSEPGCGTTVRLTVPASGRATRPNDLVAEKADFAND